MSRLIGLAAIAGIAAVLLTSPGEAAAPQSRFERAKTQATIIYRKLHQKAFYASLFADADQNELATLRQQWKTALNAAVELDPRVQKAARAYRRAQQHEEDDPDAVGRRVEDLQIISQSVAGDIEQEILERVEAVDEEVANPPPPAGGWNAEFLGYGGGLWADSFGTNYSTGIFGGRAAVGVPLTGALRGQVDIEGERTDNYCVACSNRAYLAYGGHLDWKLTPRFEIGGFGGLQNLQPTFNAPSDTNYFAGGEVRYNAGWWMAGLQAGYLDVTRGLGTLNRAEFFEGRAKVALGSAFGWSGGFNPVLGLSGGHASGSLSNTALWADSTYWSATLSQRIGGTPLTGFAGFQQYTNRVEGRGAVWNENILKAGFKVDLWNGVAAPPTVETTQPFPLAIRMNATF